jgi:hypothetical protein
MTHYQCFACGYVGGETEFVCGCYDPHEKKFLESCPNCGTDNSKTEFKVEELPTGIIIEAINRAAMLW